MARTKTIKKINLDGVEFSFDELLARPLSYRKLMKAHLKPEIYVRKEDETKEDYLKRLFNRLYKHGYAVEVVETQQTDQTVQTTHAEQTTDATPRSADAKQTSSKTTLYKTETVFKSEIVTLSTNIIHEIDKICGIEIYNVTDPLTTLLVQRLEELRSKAYAAAHIASLKE